MSIWKKPVDLAAINELTEGHADGILAIRITEIGDDFVRGGKVIGTASKL